jgi:hypothetical protein
MKLNTNLYKQKKKTMNFIKNIFLRFYFLAWFLKNSIYLAFNGAYNIPTLPDTVQRFYNNIYIRRFRVIGVVFSLLVLSDLYLHLPSFLRLLFAIVASLHITLVIIIYIIKIFYGIQTLSFKREQFEVRNSPLNRYVSIISQALYCLKFGCVVMGLGASLFAGCMIYDALLLETGNVMVFMLMLGGILKKLPFKICLFPLLSLVLFYSFLP